MLRMLLLAPDDCCRHVPVDQLPSALGMSPEAWEQAYKFPKPSPSDVVVMQCRTK